MKPEDEIDLVCQEHSTGLGLTGRLSVSQERMEACIVSFGGGFHIDASTDVNLTLEDARLATLVDNYGGLAGSSSATASSVHHARIPSNILVLGHARWDRKQQVKQVNFTFINSAYATQNHLFSRSFHIEKPEDLAGAMSGQDAKRFGKLHVSVTDFGDADVFEIEAAGLGIRLSRSRLDFEKSRSGGCAIVTIDFKEKSDIDEYIFDVLHVVTFFALSMGLASRPMAISFQTSPREGEGKEGPEFDIRYRWPEQSQEPDPFHRSILFPLRTSSDRELAAAALKIWMERRARWATAYGYAGECLRGRDELSADRLFSAFAWFEAMPLEAGQGPLSVNDVNALIQAIGSVIPPLGLDAHTRLIAGAIKGLSQASMRDRIRNCVARLEALWGVSVVPNNLADDCSAAWTLRGRLTHGAPVPKGIGNALWRGISAVEYLSFLLLIEGLGLSQSEIVSRVNGHPLAAYRMMGPSA